MPRRKAGPGAASQEAAVAARLLTPLTAQSKAAQREPAALPECPGRTETGASAFRESPKAGADLEPTKRSVSDLTPDGALLSPDPHFVLSKQHNVLLIMNSTVSPVLNTGAPSRSAALYKLSAAADSGPAGSVLAASVLLACNGIIPLTQSQLDIHYSAQVSEQTGCGKPPPGTRIPGESCV